MKTIKTSISIVPEFQKRNLEKFYGIFHLIISCKNIRILMTSECEKISKFLGGIEIDESYFKAKRIRGKRDISISLRL